MTDEERNEADLHWCDKVAVSVVNELLVAELIPEEKADWAREIIVQDIHIKLVSGFRPPS